MRLSALEFKEKLDALSAYKGTTTREELKLLYLTELMAEVLIEILAELEDRE